MTIHQESVMVLPFKFPIRAINTKQNSSNFTNHKLGLMNSSIDAIIMVVKFLPIHCTNETQMLNLLHLFPIE